MIKACPKCDTRVETNSSVHGNEKKRYRCTECGYRTDTPVEREPQGHQNGLNGMAGKLLRGEYDE